MEKAEEVFRVETVEKYQELIDLVRQTRQPVKISLAENILYYSNVDSKGVWIILGREFDLIVPETDVNFFQG
jgi:hypothetical protein